MKTIVEQAMDKLENERADMVRKMIEKKIAVDLQEKELTEWAVQMAKMAIPQTVGGTVGSQQAAVGRPPNLGALPSLESVFDRAAAANSPATLRFVKFIQDCLTPIEWIYTEIVLVPERFLGKINGFQFKTPVPANLVRGCFFGDGNVVCFRFWRPGDIKAPQMEAVYQIPEDIVKALVAEDVEKQLKS